MLNTSLRTQIILPRELRNRLDRARAVTGESLAQYLRKAARERLVAEQSQQINLEKLVQEVVGVGAKSLNRVDVVAWQRQMRRDRQ